MKSNIKLSQSINQNTYGANESEVKSQAMCIHVYMHMHDVSLCEKLNMHHLDP